MMNTQTNPRFETLQPGQARHLERLGGEMHVVSGRIWLTRDGAAGDHFLNAGDTVRIAADEYAVIESALQGEAATLRWTPRRQSLAGRIVAEPLVTLSAVLRGTSQVLAGWALGVGAVACRAQGCIEAPVQAASPASR